MKKYLAIIVIGVLLTQILSTVQVFAVYPCDSAYCPYTAPGYQSEDFILKSTPTICEMEPNDTRFPNLAQSVITTTHQGIQNWETLLNNGSKKNSSWNIDEIIVPPSDQINLDPSCNITIVYESQELDYCGQTYNGVDFSCGQIFNGKSILNSQTSTSLVFIPYLMPIYGQQCEYEKNGTRYNSICRSQQEIESQPRLLKAIQHEIGHSLGLGHFIADSQDEVNRWVAGTQHVPSIMVSGEEGALEYAKVTPLDASQIRSIYGSSGFNQTSVNSNENLKNFDTLRLQKTESHIPPWVKNLTNLWSQEKISDFEFEQSIRYLALHGIITGHTSIPLANNQVQEIPLWIKDIAGWNSNTQSEDIYFRSIVQWIVRSSSNSK